MEVSTLSESARIYIEQINNYIQKGDGYQQIRSRLLTELNKIDADNYESDETLVFNLVEELRRSIISEQYEWVSRAIDVLEDIVKYAEQTVDSAICSEQFCLSLSIVVSQRSFSPFGRTIREDNKVRLSSVVMYFYDKFSQRPEKYLHIFKLYKELKQKKCPFPEKSYIKPPKVNQFKVKTRTNNASIKGEQQFVDVPVGITYTSISDFVRESERRYREDRQSCVNTQFVRSLKVKAKALFEISQNSDGLQISRLQKEEMKQLYKRIRSMLKQIERLYEQKVQKSKIDSEKMFSNKKIEGLGTPNKNSPLKGKVTHDLLDDDFRKDIQVQKDSIESSPKDKIPFLKNVESPSKSQISEQLKSVSLLDEDEASNTKQYEGLSQSNITSKNSFGEFESSERLPNSQNPKDSQTFEIDLLDNDGDAQQKSPDFENVNVETGSRVKFSPKFSTDLIGDNEEPIRKHSSSELGQKNVKAVVYSGKINSKQSIYSNESGNEIKVRSSVGVSSKSRNANARSDKRSENSAFSGSKKSSANLEFNNAENFSRFEIVNQIIDPNSYNAIGDLQQNSSDRSGSNSHRIENSPDNDLMGQNQDIRNKPYDDTVRFSTPKKKQLQGIDASEVFCKSQTKRGAEKLAYSENYEPTKEGELKPNYDFGVLLDNREVKAVDYSVFDRHQDQEKSQGRSSIGAKSSGKQSYVQKSPSSVKQILPQSPLSGEEFQTTETQQSLGLSNHLEEIKTLGGAIGDKIGSKIGELLGRPANLKVNEDEADEQKDDDEFLDYQNEEQPEKVSNPNSESPSALKFHQISEEENGQLSPRVQKSEAKADQNSNSNSPSAQNNDLLI